MNLTLQIVETGLRPVSTSLKIFILLFFTTVNSYSQNAVTNGYKGIWFTLGQFSEYGDKYSGGLGTYTADHIPIAIYSSKAKKTFFTYGGTTGSDDRHLLIMISYFDHRTGMVPKPVIVYDKQGVDDPHDNASLSIDNEGFIWVFVSGRSRAGLDLYLKVQNLSALIISKRSEKLK